MQKLGRAAGAWLLAALVAAALGSVIQTQFNMAFLRGLEVPVTASQQLVVTLQDLLSFAPLWAVLVAVALLIGFLVASPLVKRWPQGRVLLYSLAGLTALLAMVLLKNALLQINVVAATRVPAGLVLMVLAGAVAGWVFARLGPGGAPGRRGT